MAGDIPYTAYFAKKSYLDSHADQVQRFTNAIYRGQQWVASHSASEVAQVIQPQFPDTDLAILTSAIQRYQDIGAYSETPVMTEDSFNRLQTVMQEAGELEQTVPFSEIINNTFSEKAVA